MSEGQFSHKQNTVKLRQHTKGMHNPAQFFWRDRQDFELSVVVYKDPWKRNNVYPNTVQFSIH